MLKKFSVIISAVLQLIFCISLALYNPIMDRLIEGSSEIYNLKIDSVAFDNFDDSFSVIYCFKADWQNVQDNISYDVCQGEYGIIETDENGISHLASISDKKPKDSPYVREFSVKHLSRHYNFALDESTLVSLGIYPYNYYQGYTEYEGGHDITATVRVYKGYHQIEGICIDGVPLEEILLGNGE